MNLVPRCLALGAALGAIVALGGAAAQAARTGVDFKNFTYAQHPCGPGPAVLRNGRGEYRVNDPRVDPGTVYDLGLETVDRGRIGQREAAVVVLSCEYLPGSSQTAYAYAVDGSHATYLRLVGHTYSESGAWSLDQWLRVRFAGDQLFVDVRSSGDVPGDRWTVTTYRFRGTTLRAVYSLDHKRST